MAQVTRGLRAILSASVAYDLFQGLVGAEALRKTIVTDYLTVGPHRRILDIGCGTAAILEHLPKDVEYLGFDASEAYIRTARRRFRDRGAFFTQLVTEASLEGLPGFDLVMAIGMVHHLDDSEADHLFALAARALTPEGRLCTVDPCLASPQSPIARAIIHRDRGRHVRELEGYRGLARRHFDRVEASIRHDLLRIPYTHALLTCTAPGRRASSASRT